jgi:uncharacterized protein involved in outer membrane biogenesis
LKKILIVVAILLVIVVAAGVVLVLNLDRIVEARKDELLARAQQQIGREVTVEDISVGVWPGIGASLKNVTLADDPAFSSEPFARVADLRVNVKLLPLLRKQVEVKRLVLNEVSVTLISDENGVRNIDSMIPAGSGSEEASSSEQGAAAAALVLAFADVKDGRVRYVDRATGLDHTVSDIDFTASNVSLDTEVTFQLSASLLSQETDVRVSGRAGPVGEFETTADLAGVPVDVTAELGPIAVASLPEHPALYKLAAFDVGEVDVKLAVRGTLGALRVEDLVGRAAVLGSQEANVSIAAAAEGINPLGEFDPGTISITGSVEADALSLESVREAAGSAGVARPDLRLQGIASMRASFDGKPSAMKIDAELDATGGAIAMGEGFRKPSGVPLTVAIDGTLRAPALEVAGAEIVLDELRATGSGSIGPDGVNLNLRAGDTDVAKLAALLPALSEISPAGTIALDASVKASPGGETPDVNATLTIKGGGARLAQLPKPITDATATIVVAGTSARVENASLKVGRSVINATARADRITPLEASYRITSQRIWRDDFQTPPAPAPRPEVLDNVVASGRVWSSAAAAGEAAPVQHEGTVTSSSGVVANLDYAELKATTRTEGDVIVIASFGARSLDGTVTGSGRIEPKNVPPRFDIQSDIKGVDLAQYFQYKFPAMASVLEGRIDLSLNAAGAGREWKDIATSLEGSGGAVVVRGSLLNVNLANELIGGIQGLPMVPPNLAERMRARNPRLFGGNSTAFENLDGKFTIAGGRINTSDLFLKAADFTVMGDGWLGFDSQLNIKTRFVFSQKLTEDVIRELPIAKYLRNNEGRIVLPLLFTGAVSSPRIVPDGDAISASLQQGAVDEGTDRLKDQLKGGVKDLLKGFGKKKTKPEAPDTTSGGS